MCVYTHQRIRVFAKHFFFFKFLFLFHHAEKTFMTTESSSEYSRAATCRVNPTRFAPAGGASARLPSQWLLPAAELSDSAPPGVGAPGLRGSHPTGHLSALFSRLLTHPRGFPWGSQVDGSVADCSLRLVRAAEGWPGVRSRERPGPRWTFRPLSGIHLIWV